jgi:hypothetical protein
MENMENEVRKRRKLSGEKKYQVLEEVKRNPSKKGEILRREGLYTTDIQRYDTIVRESGIAALNLNRPGKKVVHSVSVDKYNALERELAEKEKALAELYVEFVTLKKKVNGE